MNEYFEVPEEKKISEIEVYKVFSKEIDYLVNFFDCFSELLFSNGMVKSFITDKNVYLFDTSLIDSSAQTLKSIKLCCSIGSFSDANSLIRKFRDDLMLYAYIVNIINQRKPFIEDEFIEFKTEMPEELIESVMDIHFNIELTADEKAVAAWLANNVNDLPYGIKKKLEFKNYMNVLKANENIQHILSTYQLQKYWETLRCKLNDYVHNNGKNVLHRIILQSPR